MFILTSEGKRLGEVVFGGHVLKTFIAEIKEEVASRAGKTNNALIGLRAAVTLRREQVHLITKAHSSKKVSLKNIYNSECSQISAPTFDSRCFCHSSLDWKCCAHAAQAKSSEGHPLRLMVGSQGE